MIEKITTLDEAGNLYIADIGNNALDNKYLTIYKLNKRS